MCFINNIENSLLYTLFVNKRFLVVLLGVTFLTGCVTTHSTKIKNIKDAKKRPIPVVVATVTEKNIPLLVETSGTVVAYTTISIKSRIDGQLMGVYFKEGQSVKKGSLLFKIDSRSMQASLMQAQANLTKDTAQLHQAQANLIKAESQVNQAKANLRKSIAQANNANAQYKRYNNLFKQGAISKEQADQVETNALVARSTVTESQNALLDAQAGVEVAKATIENARSIILADRAVFDNAQLQLSYTSIYAPIEGRTGNLNVNQGNLVKANADTPLVVINQIQPIYVSFSIPQRLLPEVIKYNNSQELTVQAFIPNTPNNPLSGKLTFIDSGVNPETGTIQLKATFDNLDRQLIPGQFVSVVMKLAEQPNTITIPSQAIQRGQKGSFVFVVTPNKTVEIRPVIIGQTLGADTAINKGLQIGEQVVTDGQFNLTPGAKIEMKPPIKEEQLEQ